MHGHMREMLVVMGLCMCMHACRRTLCSAAPLHVILPSSMTLAIWLNATWYATHLVDFLRSFLQTTCVKKTIWKDPEVSMSPAEASSLLVQRAQKHSNTQMACSRRKGSPQQAIRQPVRWVSADALATNSRALLARTVPHWS